MSWQTTDASTRWHWATASVAEEEDLAADNWLLDVSSRCSRISLVRLILPERREGKSGVPGTTVWYSRHNRSMARRGCRSGWRHSRGYREAKRLFSTCNRSWFLQGLGLFATGGTSLHHRNLPVARKLVRNGERLLKLADFDHQLLHL